MLCADSVPIRQKEMATFSGVIHDMLTDKEMGDLIQGSITEFDHIDECQRLNTGKDCMRLENLRIWGVCN